MPSHERTWSLEREKWKDNESHHGHECLARPKNLLMIHPFPLFSNPLLLRRGQNALEANHEEIAEQVGVNVLGSPPHVFLFEAGDPFADGGFYFPLCFHNRSRTCPNSRSSRARSIAQPMIPLPSAAQQSACFAGPEPYNEHGRSGEFGLQQLFELKLSDD